MLKNCPHVKLVSCNSTKKATMEEKKQVATGDEAIAITSSSVREHLDKKKYGTQASNTNWIAKGTMPTLTIDFLSASRWNTCQIIEQRRIFAFLESWSLLCWILSIQPSLLAALHFGIASLQYARHHSVGCMRKNTSRSTYLCLIQSNIPRAQATKITFLH